MNSRSLINSLFLLFAVLPIPFLWMGCAASAPKESIVWPPPPEQARVRYEGEFRDDSSFPRSFLESVGAAIVGSNPTRRLSKPYDVAADAWGRIYVTDTGIGSVVVFDTVARELRLLGDRGQGRLSLPLGLAIADTMIFVSDGNLRRVFGYDFRGDLRLALGKADEFERPTGLAFEDSLQRLYVVDTKRCFVRVYSLTGSFLFEFGGRGKEHGQFNYPTNVTVRNAKVYVVDMMNFRVQVFDLEGKFLTSFGSAGDAPGTFARPKGIGVTSDGMIFIVDAAFNNVQVFDERGQIYLAVGGPGRTAAAFQLPAGLFIDRKDRIFVVDQLNARVQVFQYLTHH